MIGKLLHVLAGLAQLVPLILKKLREFKINKQEQILNETDITSDNSIMDSARKLHESKKE